MHYSVVPVAPRQGTVLQRVGPALTVPGRFFLKKVVKWLLLSLPD